MNGPMMPDIDNGSTRMVDVYVTESHPYYQVWVDGKVYDSFEAKFGPPLTWSQQWDVAKGYQEALTV